MAGASRAREALVGEEGVLFAAPDVDELAALLAAGGVEHRLVGPDEQRELLPVLAPPEERALFDVRGGSIRVRETIAFLAREVADRLVRAEVLATHPDGDGARLLTSDGLWRCDRVVVCAGIRPPSLRLLSASSCRSRPACTRASPSRCAASTADSPAGSTARAATAPPSTRARSGRSAGSPSAWRPTTSTRVRISASSSSASAATSRRPCPGSPSADRAAAVLADPASVARGCFRPLAGRAGPLLRREQPLQVRARAGALGRAGGAVRPDPSGAQASAVTGRLTAAASSWFAW